MQLADELSKELAGQNSKIRVTDRGHLQDLLTKDRVPAKSINERLARSIAFALNATFVVLGTTKKTDDDEVHLSTRLLDVADKDWSGYSAVVNLLAPKSNVDFSPSEPFAPLPQITSTASGESIYRPGVDGVSMPNCIYMPSPPYSEGARKFQLSGTLSAEAVIDSEGRLENKCAYRSRAAGRLERTVSLFQLASSSNLVFDCTSSELFERVGQNAAIHHCNLE
jgi:hypothetical protein